MFFTELGRIVPGNRYDGCESDGEISGTQSHTESVQYNTEAGEGPLDC